jgi:hypothetical protein
VRALRLDAPAAFRRTILQEGHAQMRCQNLPFTYVND